MSQTLRAREQGFWQERADRLTLRLNFGTWLAAFLPIAVGGSIAYALALLFLRRAGYDGPTGSTLVATLVIVGLGVRLQQHRRYTRRADALVYLDMHLGLHNRLTSAAMGVGSWPEPRAEAATLLDWRWSRIVPPILFSITLLLAAHTIPVAMDRAYPAPTEPPLAWAQIEDWVVKMREQQTAADQSLDSWQQRLDELRHQPNSEWYEMATLEASDSLRDQLEGAMASLAQDLEQVERALAALAASDPKPSTTERQSLESRLASALSRLQSGNLPADSQLLEHLRSLHNGTPSQVSSTALQALRQELADRAKLLRDAIQRDGRAGEGAAALTQLSSTAPKSCAGSDATSQSDKPGSGGISRGPGSAPIQLSADAKAYSSNDIERVRGGNSNDDAFKDGIVGQSIGTHDVDSLDFRARNLAGGAATRGVGGDLAWRDDLTPTERALLRNYFAEPDDPK